MYPGFAKTAREEGFEEISEWLETLARAEKSHAGRFGEGLESPFLIQALRRAAAVCGGPATTAPPQ